MLNVFNERIKEINERIEWWKNKETTYTTSSMRMYCKGQADGLTASKDYIERLMNSYDYLHGEDEHESQSDEFKPITFPRINTTV